MTRRPYTGGDFGPPRVYPIPIRQDVTVRIHDLPHDLTPAEAQKIANVIMALAQP